jgi:hypothetical protein
MATIFSRFREVEAVDDEEKTSNSSQSIDSDRISATDLEKQDDERREVLAPEPGVPGDESEYLDELEVEGNNIEDDETPTGGRLSAVVSRVLSKTSIKSNPGPPPDGGLQAWLMGILHSHRSCRRTIADLILFSCMLSSCHYEYMVSAMSSLSERCH